MCEFSLFSLTLSKIQYTINIGYIIYLLRSIHFDFQAIKYKDYEGSERIYKEYIDDTVKIKKVITEYIKNNSSNALNSKFIICNFDYSKGACFYMYNYNFMDENPSQPEDFQYYKKLQINLSEAQKLKDAKVISMFIFEGSDISVLKEWTELEYLNIYNLLSKEKLEEIAEILPDCKLICDGEEVKN